MDSDISKRIASEYRDGTTKDTTATGTTTAVPDETADETADAFELFDVTESQVAGWDC
jgi:hypothetical protein